MKRVLIIVGTRPNFIKVTQFKRVAKTYPDIEVKIVHTGQHYDKNMAEVFFNQFGLEPDYFLNIGSDSANTQMANIMLGLEKLILEEFRPDLLIVPGDVNSTFAAALTANKMGIKIAHLESGLRSNDREMPEEVNRILTDEISDYYFVTEESGVKNLKDELKCGEIHFVGNTMIDTLVAFESEINATSILDENKLEPQKYVLMTIHRPGNVDTKEGVETLYKLIDGLSEKYKIIFPIHPRTTKRIEEYGLTAKFDGLENLISTEPLGYFEFQKLIKHAAFVLTDSGGIQEESTFRQVPCLTLRSNTERPSTVDIGSNTLVNFNLEELTERIEQIENGSYKTSAIPPFWDGKTTERILEVISETLNA
ncbi:MAG: UDP-N-acetylglucosamine 2-epimerase (non-hydrolyzing) [Flavobacteriales bacterium]|nr:UDP-N-acetylglucosamine 2-epimerase (non-hydrolyzing) [Flavobacteriales bacterium]